MFGKVVWLYESQIYKYNEDTNYVNIFMYIPWLEFQLESLNSVRMIVSCYCMIADNSLKAG